MSDDETPEPIEMVGVREYCDDLPVYLVEFRGRHVVDAASQDGYAGTSVDLVDLLAWVLTCRPELLEEAQQQADRERETASRARKAAEDLLRWGWDHRCPRCGSTLNRSGYKVWCSFIGGGQEKPCLFGLDEPVTVEHVEALREARP